MTAEVDTVQHNEINLRDGGGMGEDASDIANYLGISQVVSFTLDGYKSEEFGAALNQEGIAVRSGHHCAQPILRRFGVETTVRPSLAFYNTYAEIDVLVNALLRLVSQKP